MDDGSAVPAPEGRSTASSSPSPPAPTQMTYAISDFKGEAEKEQVRGQIITMQLVAANDIHNNYGVDVFIFNPPA